MERPGPTWVQLGDSITEDPKGYATIIAERVKEMIPGWSWTVINAGVSGNKARDMLARFEKDVLSHQPNLVSVSVGVNDVWHGYYNFESDCPKELFDSKAGETLEDFRQDVTAMVRRLVEHAAQVILISPTMIGENPDTRENKLLTHYVKCMKEIAETFGVAYCPMNEQLWEYKEQLAPGEKLTTDGVHMNARGAEAMASILLSTLR